MNILHYIDFTDEYIVEYPCGHHTKFSVDWMHSSFENSTKMQEYCAALKCNMLGCDPNALSDYEEAEIQRQYEESIPIPGTYGAIERSTEPIKFKDMLIKTSISIDKMNSFIYDELESVDVEDYWYLVNKAKEKK